MYGIREVLLRQERNDYSEHLSQAPFELDCSMGSNPYGFCPGVSFDAGLFTEVVEYPHSDDGIKDAIIEANAGTVALGRENILLTCGSIGAILALNRMVLCPGKVVLGLAPQFSAVVDDFVTYETLYRPVYLRPERNYAFDLGEFLEAMRANPGAYIYIDNPNNPTGQVIPLADAERIVSLARELDSFVVLDEAYGDYMPPEESAMHLVGKYDNLAVMRTFSKGMGAAGIRLGYILAHPAVIAAAGKVNVPYSKNELAGRIAEELIRHDWAGQCRERVAADKPRMLASLKKLKYAETCMSVPITMLYTDDESVDLLSRTTEQHSTVTPIVRKVGGKYCLEIILRNNRVSDKYPDGIFHAHPEYHNIKKEAIGLIEGALVLFLAVWVLRRFGVSFETAPADTHIFGFFTTHTPLDVLSFL